MTHARYSAAAKFFHWSIALLLAFQLALGWRLEELPRGPMLFSAAQMHKSVGILILLLTLGRIALRYVNPPPPLMADSVWAARLAKGVHHALYVFMIGAPLTGWILVSTAKTKFATLLFGIIPWPHLPLPDSWHEPAEGLHGLLAILGLLLFALHVAGALRHQFMKDENVLGRMIPFMTAAPVSAKLAGVAAFLAIFAMWLAHGAGWQIPLGSGAASSATAPAMPPSPLVDDKPGSPADTEAAEPTDDKAKTEKAMEEADEGEGDEKKIAVMPLSGWAVAPGGRLGFVASWSGTPVNGSFGRWTSNIKFSPDDLAKSSIRVAVDLASADTADSQRDEMLHGDSFLNAPANPQAVFTSSAIMAKGGDRYQAKGSLSLNGRSRPVTLDFTLKIKDEVAKVSGTTRLDRTSFGVGAGEWAATDQIAANVAVNFTFTARKS
jgi:cytochrome b561/polyisoprenoid-binding protein YceI